MRMGIEGNGRVGDMVCEVLRVGWRCVSKVAVWAGW